MFTHETTLPTASVKPKTTVQSTATNPSIQITAKSSRKVLPDDGKFKISLPLAAAPAKSKEVVEKRKEVFERNQSE